MTKDDMLAASQAQMIYIIMMIIESGLRKEEWVRELLVLSGVSFLLEINIYVLNCVQSVCQRMWILVASDETSAMFPSNDHMSWEDWIYQESRKRYRQICSTDFVRDKLMAGAENSSSGWSSL